MKKKNKSNASSKERRSNYKTPLSSPRPAAVPNTASTKDISPSPQPVASVPKKTVPQDKPKEKEKERPGPNVRPFESDSDPPSSRSCDESFGCIELSSKEDSSFHLSGSDSEGTTHIVEKIPTMTPFKDVCPASTNPPRPAPQLEQKLLIQDPTKTRMGMIQHIKESTEITEWPDMDWKQQRELVANYRESMKEKEMLRTKIGVLQKLLESYKKALTERRDASGSESEGIAFVLSSAEEEPISRDSTKKKNSNRNEERNAAVALSTAEAERSGKEEEKKEIKDGNDCKGKIKDSQTALPLPQKAENVEVDTSEALQEKSTAVKKPPPAPVEGQNQKPIAKKGSLSRKGSATSKKPSVSGKKEAKAVGGSRKGSEPPPSKKASGSGTEIIKDLLPQGSGKEAGAILAATNNGPELEKGKKAEAKAVAEPEKKEEVGCIKAESNPAEEGKKSAKPLSRTAKDRKSSANAKGTVTKTAKGAVKEEVKKSTSKPASRKSSVAEAVTAKKDNKEPEQKKAERKSSVHIVNQAPGNTSQIITSPTEDLAERAEKLGELGDMNLAHPVKVVSLFTDYTSSSTAKVLSSQKEKSKEKSAKEAARLVKVISLFTDDSGTIKGEKPGKSKELEGNTTKCTSPQASDGNESSYGNTLKEKALDMSPKRFGNVSDINISLPAGVVEDKMRLSADEMLVKAKTSDPSFLSGEAMKMGKALSETKLCEVVLMKSSPEITREIPEGLSSKAAAADSTARGEQAKAILLDCGAEKVNKGTEDSKKGLDTGKEDQSEEKTVPTIEGNRGDQGTTDGKLADDLVKKTSPKLAAETGHSDENPSPPPPLSGLKSGGPIDTADKESAPAAGPTKASSPKHGEETALSQSQSAEKPSTLPDVQDKDSNRVFAQSIPAVPIPSKTDNNDASDIIKSESVDNISKALCKNRPETAKQTLIASIPYQDSSATSVQDKACVRPLVISELGASSDPMHKNPLSPGHNDIPPIPAANNLLLKDKEPEGESTARSHPATDVQEPCQTERQGCEVKDIERHLAKSASVTTVTSKGPEENGTQHRKSEEEEDKKAGTGPRQKQGKKRAGLDRFLKTSTKAAGNETYAARSRSQNKERDKELTSTEAGELLPASVEKGLAKNEGGAAEGNKGAAPVAKEGELANLLGQKGETAPQVQAPSLSCPNGGDSNNPQEKVAPTSSPLQSSEVDNNSKTPLTDNTVPASLRQGASDVCAPPAQISDNKKEEARLDKDAATTAGNDELKSPAASGNTEIGYKEDIPRKSTACVQDHLVEEPASLKIGNEDHGDEENRGTTSEVAVIEAVDNADPAKSMLSMIDVKESQCHELGESAKKSLQVREEDKGSLPSDAGDQACSQKGDSHSKPAEQLKDKDHEQTDGHNEEANSGSVAAIPQAKAEEESDVQSNEQNKDFAVKTYKEFVATAKNEATLTKEPTAERKGTVQGEGKQSDISPRNKEEEEKTKEERITGTAVLKEEAKSFKEPRNEALNSEVGENESAIHVAAGPPSSSLKDEKTEDTPEEQTLPTGKAEEPVEKWKAEIPSKEDSARANEASPHKDELASQTLDKNANSDAAVIGDRPEAIKEEEHTTGSAVLNEEPSRKRDEILNSEINKNKTGICIPVEPSSNQDGTQENLASKVPAEDQHELKGDHAIRDNRSEQPLPAGKAAELAKAEQGVITGESLAKGAVAANESKVGGIADKEGAQTLLSSALSGEDNEKSEAKQAEIAPIGRDCLAEENSKKLSQTILQDKEPLHTEDKSEAREEEKSKGHASDIIIIKSADREKTSLVEQQDKEPVQSEDKIVEDTMNEVSPKITLAGQRENEPIQAEDRSAEKGEEESLEKKSAIVKEECDTTKKATSAAGGSEAVQSSIPLGNQIADNVSSEPETNKEKLATAEGDSTKKAAGNNEAVQRDMLGKQISETVSGTPRVNNEPETAKVDPDNNNAAKSSDFNESAVQPSAAKENSIETPSKENLHDNNVDEKAAPAAENSEHVHKAAAKDDLEIAPSQEAQQQQHFKEPEINREAAPDDNRTVTKSPASEMSGGNEFSEEKKDDDAILAAGENSENVHKDATKEELADQTARNNEGDGTDKEKADEKSAAQSLSAADHDESCKGEKDAKEDPADATTPAIPAAEMTVEAAQKDATKEGEDKLDARVAHNKGPEIDKVRAGDSDKCAAQSLSASKSSDHDESCKGKEDVKEKLAESAAPAIENNAAAVHHQLTPTEDKERPNEDKETSSDPEKSKEKRDPARSPAIPAANSNAETAQKEEARAGSSEDAQGERSAARPDSALATNCDQTSSPNKDTPELPTAKADNAHTESKTEAESNPHDYNAENKIPVDITKISSEPAKPDLSSLAAENGSSPVHRDEDAGLKGEFAPETSLVAENNGSAAVNVETPEKAAKESLTVGNSETSHVNSTENDAEPKEKPLLVHQSAKDGDSNKEAVQNGATEKEEADKSKDDTKIVLSVGNYDVPAADKESECAAQLLPSAKDNNETPPRQENTQQAELTAQGSEVREEGLAVQTAPATDRNGADEDTKHKEEAKSHTDTKGILSSAEEEIVEGSNTKAETIPEESKISGTKETTDVNNNNKSETSKESSEEKLAGDPTILPAAQIEAAIGNREDHPAIEVAAAESKNSSSVLASAGVEGEESILLSQNEQKNEPAAISSVPPVKEATPPVEDSESARDPEAAECHIATNNNPAENPSQPTASHDEKASENNKEPFAAKSAEETHNTGDIINGSVHDEFTPNACKQPKQDATNIRDIPQKNPSAEPLEKEFDQSQAVQEQNSSEDILAGPDNKAPLVSAANSQSSTSKVEQSRNRDRLAAGPRLSGGLELGENRRNRAQRRNVVMVEETTQTEIEYVDKEEFDHASKKLAVTTSLLDGALSFINSLLEDGRKPEEHRRNMIKIERDLETLMAKLDAAGLLKKHP